MLAAALWVCLGIGLLVVGGELLLRGSVGLATLAKLSPAVIGLTVVAAGTSVPELAVSTIASYRGNNDIAVANVVGSNIFNLTFILGLCALVRPFPISSNTLKMEYPVLLVVTVLGYFLLADLSLSRIEAVLLMSIYVAFTTFLVLQVRKQMTRREEKILEKEVEELEPTKSPTLWLSLVFLISGIALLGFGAQATVSGASDLARIWGWSERLIGLTIVSVGTSLPEVVASLMSSLRGRSDVAIGNVIGSNLFNLLMILGISATVSPITLSSSVSSDCLWMVLVTIALAPLLWNGKKIYRWEGLVLLLIYAVYLGLLLRS
ncbi:MAG: calcium/sodium antiporter [Pirellulales bacterium]